MCRLSACSCLQLCFFRDSQSFQHRTLVPVHACSLDSGPPRYDSLTVSYGPPPSCESFVRFSVTPRALPTPHQTPEPQGRATASSRLHCLLLLSAWVLSPCIATLDNNWVRASHLEFASLEESRTLSSAWRLHCFHREALPLLGLRIATWRLGRPSRRRCKPCMWK